MQSLAEFLAIEKSRHGGPRLVENWTEYVPSGSRWRPGDVGDAGCPTCLGVGYVRLDLPLSHPDFGKLFTCDCAAERVRAINADRLQKVAGLTAGDLDLTWGGIIATPGLQPAVAAVRDTLARGWGWVYLHSQPGPGKTLLLKTAISETLRAGRGGVMVMWPDLLDHLRQGYDAGDYDARLAAWRDAPVLAVDEFGRAKDSEWVREAQVKIFAPRYESALAKRTVTLFASNFVPESAEGWFADRVRDSRFSVVAIVGPSMRPLMGDE
jgi:DNA replication protein DnaC